MNQILESQRASYGVYIMSILENIDRVIKALHCIEMGTRASVAAVRSIHPCISSCLWVNLVFSNLVLATFQRKLPPCINVLQPNGFQVLVFAFVSAIRGL